MKRAAKNFTLETYDDADWDTVQEHIAKYFGDYDNVMHEIASEGIHLDVCVIPPREETVERCVSSRSAWARTK